MRFYVDGEFVERENASVSAENRGLLYGDGFTERLRAYGGTVFEWSTHERRIETRCEALSIPVPAGLRDRIAETLAANDLADAVVRLSITRGGGSALVPDLDATPVVVIAVEAAPRGGRSGGDLESEDGGENGTEPAVVQTVTVRRPSESDPLAERSARIRASLELARAATEAYRAEEALLRDAEGHVAGGATSDLLFVDGALRVPAADPVGVLRPVVCDLAREENIPIETGRYSPSTVREASEAFLASAIGGIRPVSRLDGIAVGGGAVTRLLAATLDELIEEQY
jgi:branched-chain amino acid aminotransferase